MTDLCPSCGYDLTPDRPIVRGRWQVLPDEARYCGIKVDLTRQQARLFHSIAKAGGAAVSTDALMQRISDSEGVSRRLVQVLVCKVRSIMGPLCPIETVHGDGYRWNDGQEERHG